MHYKAPDNSLHFLDDDSFVHCLPIGSVKITDAEADAIRLEKGPTLADLKANALAQVVAAPQPTFADVLEAINATPGPLKTALDARIASKASKL